MTEFLFHMNNYSITGAITAYQTHLKGIFNALYLEYFYWKIKKIINVSTTFFLSYKSGIKNSMKWFIIILWSNLYYF